MHVSSHRDLLTVSLEDETLIDRGQTSRPSSSSSIEIEMVENGDCVHSCKRKCQDLHESAKKCQEVFMGLRGLLTIEKGYLGVKQAEGLCCGLVALTTGTAWNRGATRGIAGEY
jgi:hypothetical protein